MNVLGRLAGPAVRPCAKIAIENAIAATSFMVTAAAVAPIAERAVGRVIQAIEDRRRRQEEEGEGDSPSSGRSFFSRCSLPGRHKAEAQAEPLAVANGKEKTKKRKTTRSRPAIDLDQAE